MISELLTVTDAAYGGSLPVTTRHLFAQIVNGVPAVHNGGGQFTPVANDLNGSWSYQRFRGPIEAIPSQLVGDPCTGVRVSVPLRIVALLPRDVCMEVAQAAVASLRGAATAAKVAIGAANVRFDRVTWTIAETAAGEFSPTPQIPTSKALLIIDLTVTIEASQACVSACEATDVTCALIEAASLGKIRECLGDRLAELCEFEPGDLCTEIAKVGSTAAAIVECIEDAGKTAAVQALICEPCPPPEPCDPELELRLNGGRVYKILDLECGIQEFDNIVTYPDGTPVGEWNTIEGRIEVPAPIPCDPCPLGYTLQDTAENVILTGLVNDPCEDPTLLLTAPDGSVQLQDSAGNPINPPVAVRSGQTGVAVIAPNANVMTTDGLTTIATPASGANYDVPQSVIKFKDAANADQVTAASNTEFAGGTLRPATQIPRITIYESDGVTVQGFSDVGNPFYTVDACPPCPTLCTQLGDVLPANAQTQILDCVTPETEDAIGAILWPAGEPIIYTLGRIMHSGQETIYQAGDEGTMFASGQFDYNPTIGPNSVLQRLGANFVTLLNNNSFGNTLRFTNRAGGAAANSGNRFIMDHYTGYEWYVLGTLLTAANWAAAVTAGVNINATLGETGWFLPNDRLLDSITNDNSAAFISANPFAVSGNDPLWTSSTAPGSTANAKFLSVTIGQLGANAKTTATYRHGLYCRRFAP